MLLASGCQSRCATVEIAEKYSAIREGTKDKSLYVFVKDKYCVELNILIEKVEL